MLTPARAPGSDPGMTTRDGAVAQLVERIVRNDEVESSNLFRSTWRKRRKSKGLRRLAFWRRKRPMTPTNPSLPDAFESGHALLGHKATARRLCHCTAIFEHILSWRQSRVFRFANCGLHLQKKSPSQNLRRPCIDVCRRPRPERDLKTHRSPDIHQAGSFRGWRASGVLAPGLLQRFRNPSPVGHRSPDQPNANIRSLPRLDTPHAALVPPCVSAGRSNDSHPLVGHSVGLRCTCRTLDRHLEGNLT